MSLSFCNSKRLENVGFIQLNQNLFAFSTLCKEIHRNDSFANQTCFYVFLQSLFFVQIHIKLIFPGENKQQHDVWQYSQVSTKFIYENCNEHWGEKYPLVGNENLNNSGME